MLAGSSIAVGVVASEVLLVRILNAWKDVGLAAAELLLVTQEGQEVDSAEHNGRRQVKDQPANKGSEYGTVNRGALLNTVPTAP